MHEELTPTYLLLVLLAERRNIFHAIGSMSLIRSVLNEGRKKRRAVGNKGRTVTMRKKTLCDVYTKVDDEQVLRRTKLQRGTNVYLVVHAIHRYRRRIIYNEPRNRRRERERERGLNLRRIKGRSVRNSVFGLLRVSRLRICLASCFRVHSRKSARGCAKRYCSREESNQESRCLHMCV